MNLLPKLQRVSVLAGVLLACCLFLTLGCGPDHKARGAVKGRVTSNKKPLTTGTVMFINPQGVSASATIDGEGNYDMKDAPVGECTVTVTVPDMPMDPSVRARLTGKGSGPKMPEMKVPEGVEGPPMPAATKLPKEIVPADAKYSKPETSGLKFKVEKGEQHTYNIDL
jgi:hypothetical protein